MTTVSFSASYTDLPKSLIGVISAMLHYDGEAARYDATRQHGPLGSLSRPAG